jgi:transcription antitermination factor NusG
VYYQWLADNFCEPQSESFITMSSGLRIDEDLLVAWYAVYARHQHEKTVAQILTRRGFDTLLPLYESKRKWQDRMKILQLPLFPCYVFVRSRLTGRLSILNTPGVIGLVSSAGKPVSIPSGQIEAIQRASDSGLPIEPHPLLRCGDLARVKFGPLAGSQGILIRKKNIYRLVLSVEMLGQAVAVEVDSTMVEKLRNEGPVFGTGPKRVASPPISMQSVEP